MAQICPVILSGGGGTRLWPLSTPAKPKQFLPLTEDLTMFQLTALRTAGRTDFAPPQVIANVAHADLVKTQLSAIGIDNARILLEPCARNTAPAIALAAWTAPMPDSLLLVMPSDHVITDLPAFLDAIDTATALAQDGWLVTFGIDPTGPETGYGYIATGDALPQGGRAVSRFIEKPDATRAQAMIDAGGHYWNGGIFLFRASALLDELARHAPAIHAATQQSIALAVDDLGADNGVTTLPDAAAFAASPSDSIDYAVMEKAGRVATVPVRMGWSDVGCWDALHEIGPSDPAGNVLRGAIRQIDASGNLICTDGIRVSTIGIADLIIVASGNEVLILPRGQSQRVKLLA